MFFRTIWTWRRSISLIWIWSETFFQAWRRVEWVLPPNEAAIFMRESSIISLARYIATWRARAISLWRDSPLISEMRTSKTAATLFKISSTEIFLLGAAVWNISLKIFSTTSSLSCIAIRREWAQRRLIAP